MCAGAGERVCVCACFFSTTSHLDDRPRSLFLSLSLGKHSFKPNPAHSPLTRTLVVDARRMHNSHFPGGGGRIKIASFVGQALTVLSPSLFEANSGRLFSLLADSNESHA